MDCDIPLYILPLKTFVRVSTNSDEEDSTLSRNSKMKNKSLKEIVSLQEFGLTEEEARVYVTLLKLGPSKVREISNHTQIDRVRLYKILDGLQGLGLAHSILSSPVVYGTNDPKTALQNIINNKKSEIKKLEITALSLFEDLTVLEKRHEQIQLPKFTVISGRSKIYDQISKIIDDAKDYIYITTTVADISKMYYTSIPESIERSRKRGIEIRIFTESEAVNNLEYFKRLGIDVLKVGSLPSKGRIVCEPSLTLFSTHTGKDIGGSASTINEDSAILTNSEDVVGSMQSLCFQLWDKGEQVDIRHTVPSTNDLKKVKTQILTRAIIVDDDKISLDTIEDMLERRNISVIGKAYNGKEAVEMYQKFKPDVVFLDVFMPDYDGLYALEKIRQINPAANVIMVTGDSTFKTDEKLKELKPSGVIYKPYNIDSIINKI